MTTTYISTAGMSRDEWLRRRRNSIGGSDAAAILGLSKYSTMMTVWGDKTGRLPAVEDNEALRQGRDFEEYVAQRFCEATGKRVQRYNRMIYNPEYPYSHADIDRKVIGERAGLECKTMSDPFAVDSLEKGEVPTHYYCQCVHYLAVTGFERWYLFILVFGRGVYLFTIERNEEEIGALMQAERDFWEDYVLSDVPPPVDGMKPTTKALGGMYPESRNEVVELEDRMLYEYEALRKASDEAEIALEKSRQAIMAAMGEAECGDGGGYDVTWKTRERVTYDVKRLMREHPEIDMSPYKKTTTYKTFTVKEQ